MQEDPKMKNKDKCDKKMEEMAERTLTLAGDALEQLEAQVSECGTRDLLNIFTSSLKAHKEILAIIAPPDVKESNSEKEMAKSYDGQLNGLLKRLEKGG